LLIAAGGLPLLAQESEPVSRSVHTRVQPRPGAEAVEIDMAVHEAPVDPPLVGADEVALAADELVLGIERDGEAVAFPISTLANFEVLNSRIGKLPLAPTW